MSAAGDGPFADYPRPIRIVAVIGSLRRGSYNRMLYQEMKDLLPEGMTLEEASIADIPAYNDDVRTGPDYPESVTRLREELAAADAVLFVTPENNHSIPGVLKNALDWVSRPMNDQPLRGKPAALMGVSTGRLGTVRMQEHLRAVLGSLGCLVLVQPEVFIGDAAARFKDGHLVDEKTRSVVERDLQALKEWVLRLQRSDVSAGVAAD